MDSILGLGGMDCSSIEIAKRRGDYTRLRLGYNRCLSYSIE